SMQRRCCAPGSSATGPGDPPTCPEAVGWVFTASVAAPTSPRRSRCTWASGYTFSPAASTTRNSPVLGVDSIGAATDAPPEPLDGAILFAPAGELVPV